MRAASVSKLRLPATVVVRRRLLVVEGGATVFSPDGADGFDETVALLELEGDEPAEFADRVLRRLATAQQSGQSFDAALLFVGSSTDARVQAARRLIALGIADHAQTSPHLSELVIVARASASLALRDQLLQLADELVLCSDQEPLPVRVRFADPKPPPISGVFERIGPSNYRH
jgi:hypothetical protein